MHKGAKEKVERKTSNLVSQLDTSGVSVYHLSFLDKYAVNNEQDKENEAPVDAESGSEENRVPVIKKKRKNGRKTAIISDEEDERAFVSNATALENESINSAAEASNKSQSLDLPRRSVTISAEIYDKMIAVLNDVRESVDQQRREQRRMRVF